NGPFGVSYSLPKFTFSSDIPGSVFECRIDDGPFVRCGSPHTPTGQDLGVHLIHGRALSPEGVTDLTPAIRSFTLGVKTLKKSCSRLVSFGGGRGTVYGSDECTLFENEKCPVGSVCTSKFVVNGGEKDFRFTHSVNAQMVTAGAIIGSSGVTCWVDQIPLDTPRCPVTESQSVLGTGQTLRAFCENISSIPTGYDYVRGPDEDRRISCDVTFTVRPAGSLTTISAGDTVSIFAPGAGTIGITSGGPVGTRALTTVARKSKPAFKPAKRTVKKAGPVTFKLKLTKVTKKKLKKKGKVKLAVRISFKSSVDGKSISKRVQVKLTKKVKRQKKKRR
ncbi:MAG: hypothetical protein ACSLFD_03335, partial [Solirubrobacterales bacterium]